MDSRLFLDRLKRLFNAFITSSDTPKGADIPGFRHRTSDPEYARLALPFCRQDSIRKLAVLLDEEAALVNRNQS